MAMAMAKIVLLVPIVLVAKQLLKKNTQSAKIKINLERGSGLSLAYKQINYPDLK